ncbi:helix-turn-helix domain-containing protein [Pseudonocardia nematodicida]|uniref:Helix-turn-helix domain-containing protein n=1 Tax=Pseudonocardia nematodicida TaxID=1206997 RepID=A0ABV1KEG6_9PSEU
MSKESEDRTFATFADRLNYLFATVYPAGRKPYSNPEVAAAISEAGVSISAAYLWLLRSGQRDNPTMRHLEALAKFFGVPPAYFFDDAMAKQVAEQLELLTAARDAEVREIMLRSTRLSKPDRSTILGIVKRFGGSHDTSS